MGEILGCLINYQYYPYELIPVWEICDESVQGCFDTNDLGQLLPVLPKGHKAYPFRIEGCFRRNESGLLVPVINFDSHYCRPPCTSCTGLGFPTPDSVSISLSGWEGKKGCYEFQPDLYNWAHIIYDLTSELSGNATLHQITDPYAGCGYESDWISEDLGSSEMIWGTCENPRGGPVEKVEYTDYKISLRRGGNVLGENANIGMIIKAKVSSLDTGGNWVVEESTIFQYLGILYLLGEFSDCMLSSDSSWENGEMSSDLFTGGQVSI